VAKNKDIDGRMRKETDFKPKQNVRRICSYGDLDNIAYFCFFFWTPLAFFPDLWLGNRVYVLTHRPYALTHRVYALTHSGLKVASADPVR
jgi:hypothetical protein